MERLRAYLWSFPGLLIWMAAVGLLAYRLTVPWGVTSAVAGAAVGFAAAALLARGPVRLPIIWVGAGVTQLLLGGLSGALRNHALMARIVGPEACYTLAEVIWWFGSMVVVVGLVMASSRRQPAFLTLEVGLVAAVVAGVFASHRDGLISRPYFLVDPLWGRGYDPLPVFLGLGAALAGLLVLLLASRAPERRSYPALGLLVLVIVLVFVFLPVSRLKDLPQLRSTPPPSGTPSASPPPGAPGEGSPSPTGSPSPSHTGSPTPGGSPSPSGGESPTPGATPSPSSGAGASPSPGPSSSPGARGGESSKDGQGRRGEFKDLETRTESREGANHPVAVVLFQDDYDPPEGLYYFRQTVFSQWNGMTLVRDQGGTYDRDVAESFPEGTITVRCEATSPTAMRPLETVVALAAPHLRPFGLLNPEAFESTENPDPRRFQRAYRVRSRVPTRPLRDLLGRTAGSPSWSRETWIHYTEGPTDPRYGKLATEATSTLKPGFGADPLARALAVKMLLEKTGTYDLKNHTQGSADPVGDFLFGARIGYCVHFSRAAVHLFRSLGIPARVGTGYAVQARNRGRGSAVLVRAGESHAWPEIYLEDLGWVVVDITPAKSLVPPISPPDQDIQQMMGDMARKKQERPPTEEPPVADGDLQKAFRDLLMWGLGHLWWFLGIALAALYGVKAWRRIAPRLGGAGVAPTLYYRAALDALADCGRVRRYGETREAFAREVAKVAPSLEPLTQAHLQERLDRRERWAGAAPCPPRDLYHRVRREISTHVPLLRRIAGLLDPLSWWRVR